MAEIQATGRYSVPYFTVRTVLCYRTICLYRSFGRRNLLGTEKGRRRYRFLAGLPWTIVTTVSPVPNDGEKKIPETVIFNSSFKRDSSCIPVPEIERGMRGTRLPMSEFSMVNSSEVVVSLRVATSRGADGEWGSDWEITPDSSSGAAAGFSGAITGFLGASDVC